MAKIKLTTTVTEEVEMTPENIKRVLTEWGKGTGEDLIKRFNERKLNNKFPGKVGDLVTLKQGVMDAVSAAAPEALVLAYVDGPTALCAFITRTGGVNAFECQADAVESVAKAE